MNGPILSGSHTALGWERIPSCKVRPHWFLDGGEISWENLRYDRMSCPMIYGYPSPGACLTLCPTPALAPTPYFILGYLSSDPLACLVSNQTLLVGLTTELHFLSFDPRHSPRIPASRFHLLLGSEALLVPGSYWPIASPEFFHSCIIYPTDIY